MNKTRRITANIPEQLLKDAESVTNKGITETLIIGLELINRRKAATIAAKLKGKLHLNIELDASRERNRR